MAEVRARGRSPETVGVIGGGVIGLACARTLAEAGAQVTVVDPGQRIRRAGWAAGGMLAPLAEAVGPGKFLEMAQRSLHLYPDFVSDLEASTGLDLGLHLNGKLLTAYDEEAEEALRRRMRALDEDGGDVMWLGPEGVRRLEPALSPELRGALLLRGQGRVDNRTLSVALERDCVQRGVEFVQGRVTALEVRGGRLEGLRIDTAPGLLGCSAGVLCAGAWSAGIGGLPRRIPVRPVKGQMLSLQAPDPPLTRVATAGDRYLIPRQTAVGPVIVVGATQEEAGFDLGTDEPGQASLHEAAVRLVPSLIGCRVVERWAGLRPGTPDGLPILGPDPELPDLCYATGHHRNGVLLAPFTAEHIRGWWGGRG